jgi:hypothetical protein
MVPISDTLFDHQPCSVKICSPATHTPYPGFKGRNPFQTDLKILSDLVLEDIPRGEQVEEEFLKECYCPSGALSQYALISKEILRARYSALFDHQTPGPTLIPAATREGITPELIAESLSRRPILLLGDVGVGKTMFILHLIKVEAAELFKEAITLYLDFGTHAALSATLRDFVLDEITRQLHEEHAVDVDQEQFVRGVWFPKIHVH